MKLLLSLINKLYGSKAIQKTIGTRTNVITLPNKQTKQLLNEQLNVNQASDQQILKLKDDIEKLIPDIPKMNDSEVLNLTSNLQKIDNRLNPPQAEIIEMGTKQPVSPAGIEQLAAERGMRTRQGYPSMQREGMVRTAAREIMMKDIKSGKLKIKDPGEDPIDTFRRYYGEDRLADIDDVADELLPAQSYTEIQDILKQKKLYDLPVKKKGAGEYDPAIKEGERITKDIEEGKIKPMNIEPEEFAIGGRVGFSTGKLAKTAFDKIYDNYFKIKSLKDTVNKKMGEGTLKTAEEIARPESAITRDLFKRMSKKLKNKLPKKGEFIEDGETPDYEYYAELLNDAEDSRGFNVQGDETIEVLEDRLKQLKDEEAYWYGQYKAGKLDPEPGEINRSRLTFLKNKLKEAETSGDKRLITQDELEELDSLEKRFEYLDLEEKAQDVNRKLTNSEIERLKEINDSGYVDFQIEMDRINRNKKATGGRVGFAQGANKKMMIVDLLNKGADLDLIKTITEASDEEIMEAVDFFKYGGAGVPLPTFDDKGNMIDDGLYKGRETRPEAKAYGGRIGFSDGGNDALLEQLYEKFLDLGLSPKDAADAARKEFEQRARKAGGGIAYLMGL